MPPRTLILTLANDITTNNCVWQPWPIQFFLRPTPTPPPPWKGVWDPPSVTQGDKAKQIWLKYTDCNRAALQLRVGDVVERHLWDGARGLPSKPN